MDDDDAFFFNVVAGTWGANGSVVLAHHSVELWCGVSGSHVNGTCKTGVLAPTPRGRGHIEELVFSRYSSCCCRFHQMKARKYLAMNYEFNRVHSLARVTSLMRPQGWLLNFVQVHSSREFIYGEIKTVKHALLCVWNY